MIAVWYVIRGDMHSVEQSELLCIHVDLGSKRGLDDTLPDLTLGWIQASSAAGMEA